MRRDMQRTMDYSMKVRKITVPKGHRIIITSDIHGNLSYLKGLLDKVSFSKEDYFFIAGDLVEKGGDSLATLRYLMELERNGYNLKSQKDKCNVVPWKNITRKSE